MSSRERMSDVYPEAEAVAVGCCPMRIDVIVLRIYDVAGRLVAIPLERVIPAGGQEVTWTGISNQGSRLGSGVFAVLEMGGARTTTRMTLLR